MVIKARSIIIDSDLDYKLLQAEVFQEGFAAIRNPFGEETCLQIVKEGQKQFADAKRVSSNGELKYRSRLSHLGPVAQVLLQSQCMRHFLQEVFGQNFKLNPNSSCYTYYREGDFLSAHKDGADDCDVTVLIYFEASLPQFSCASDGMFLRIYEDVNAKPGRETKLIRTGCGLVVVGRGSQHWHGRLPLEFGEAISMVTACFVTAL